MKQRPTTRNYHTPIGVNTPAWCMPSFQAFDNKVE